MLPAPHRAGGAEAGLHLVEDQQRLALVGDPAQGREELAAEVVVPALALDRLEDDRGDLVYLTGKEKFRAIIEDIKDCVGRGQPVLVGTVSIETSEFLSGLLGITVIAVLFAYEAV